MEVGEEKIRVIREDFMYMSEAVGLKLSPILPSNRAIPLVLVVWHD